MKIYDADTPGDWSLVVDNNGYAYQHNLYVPGHLLTRTFVRITKPDEADFTQNYLQFIVDIMNGVKVADQEVPIPVMRKFCVREEYPDLPFPGNWVGFTIEFPVVGLRLMENHIPGDLSSADYQEYYTYIETLYTRIMDRIMEVANASNS